MLENKLPTPPTPPPATRLKSVWYATGEEQRTILIAPVRMKQLGQSGNGAQLWMCLVVKVKPDACKEHYSPETWNVRSMNQGKLDVVKQEMEKLNINILGISELQNGQEWENLIQMTIVSTTVGKNPIEEIE